MKPEKGMKVRIIDNAKNTCWEYGFIAEIRDNEALINYGSVKYPVYGMGIRKPLSELEVLEERD